MSDYIKREDAIKRFTFATLDCLGMEPTIRASDVVKALESLPAADVVEAVRCKDCKSFWYDEREVSGKCSRHDIVMEISDYCSRGRGKNE